MNFFYQDAIDLILGNYTVEENEGISRPSPLQAERDWKFYAVSPACIILNFRWNVLSNFFYQYKAFQWILKKWNNFKYYGIDDCTFQDEFKQMYMCKLLTQGKFGFALEHMYELFLVTECYLYTAIHYMCLL